jgi:hypothetical protein
VRGFGWRNEFRETSWAEVREFLSEVDWTIASADYLFEIIDSVTATGADEMLAVTTSMHDIVVAPRPALEPPSDVIIVRAPGSLYPAPSGLVAIEHVAVSGRNTRIERPVAEATRLFWRLLDVEFGIRSSA